MADAHMGGGGGAAPAPPVVQPAPPRGGSVSKLGDGIWYTNEDGSTTFKTKYILGQGTPTWASCLAAALNYMRQHPNDPDGMRSGGPTDDAGEKTNNAGGDCCCCQGRMMMLRILSCSGASCTGGTPPLPKTSEHSTMRRPCTRRKWTRQLGTGTQRFAKASTQLETCCASKHVQLQPR